MMQWTGPALQVIAVPWTKISDAASANAFADKIAAAPRALFGGGTSISGAIDTGMALLFDNPYRATRRVIDISGDGSNNRGRLVNQARDEAVRAGVGINGLPILALEPDLDRYYRAQRDRRAGRVRDCREGLQHLRRRDPEEADRGDRRDRSGVDRREPQGRPAGSLATSAYFSWSATLSRPACTQTSSLSPPGAPDTPTAPITSSPALTGSAPASAITLVR